MSSFIQLGNRHTTLDHLRDILDQNDLESLAAFAYATDSGVSQIWTHLGRSIDGVRRNRWLLGIDFGRSRPAAIRKLAEFGQAEIRIHDGAYVVESQGFIPRVSFHLKTMLVLDSEGYPLKQVVGSGNLSASGLSAGIEAGALVDFAKFKRSHCEELIQILEGLWDNGTPFEEIIDQYEDCYAEEVLPPNSSLVDQETENVQFFWIDVGYVTKNRGEDKPGNQFDLPRGSHVHLGLEKVVEPDLNAVLGEIDILTPTGELVARNLRFGNNSMEKLTLPIPEEYGYECYDGKILTFEVSETSVVLNALEHDDFFRLFGSNISACYEMQSGRRYGIVAKS